MGDRCGIRGAGGGGGIGEGKMCEVGCGQQRQKTPNSVRGTRKRAEKNKNRKWVKKISQGEGGNNQLTDYTMWRRTNGLQYEEERKEEDQLKDDGVWERWEENENEDEQNHGLKHLAGTQRGTKRGNRGGKECKTLVMKRMQWGIHESKPTAERYRGKLQS